MKRTTICLSLLILLPLGTARADLAAYIKRPEPKFTWKLNQKIEMKDGVIWDLELVSQEWQGIVWKHQLQVYQPKEAVPAATMLVYNTGGTANVANIALGISLAKLTKTPVAVLYGIPNQPLFGGKKEDALIAETFVRYLETHDDSWPLLFPMVKSVVKAMDALQAFAMQEWKQPVKNFVIAGASKRGWTTWLTGASDPRVKAIAPLVIDTLNMVEQMEHAKQSFGRYSEMVKDYTERKLVPLPPGEDAKKLWQMVDPYTYREKLTMPKLLINGNNDPYWTVDATNLYWDSLKGEKYIAYVPNAGHDLKEPDGTHNRAFNALAAFFRHQLKDNPMPKVTWKHDTADGMARLTVSADVPPKAARLWVATAATQDFRKAKWEEKTATIDKGHVTGSVMPPKEGYLAYYAELEYEIDGITHSLCTQIQVVGAK